MTSSTDRKVRRAGREEHTHKASVYAHALCTRAFNHTYAGRQAHTSTPHHPRSQHTVSPDKLESVRACWFLTLQVSVTFLSELHVVSHQDKERLSLALSLFLFLSPSFASFLPFSVWSRNREQKSASHAA